MSTIKSSGENLKLSSDNTKDVEIQHNGTTHVTVKSDGNVGIGTTSPSSALDVIGEAEFGDGTRGVKLSYSAGNNSGIIDTTDSGDTLEFRIANSEKMRITSTGNVGIGTSNPLSVTHTVSPSNSTMALIVQNDVVGNAGEAWLGFKAQESSDDERVKGAIVYQNQNSGTGVGDMLFLLDSAEDNGNVTTSQEVMRIDSAGRVTMPYQPSFFVNGSPSTTNNEVHSFGSTLYNTGNHYVNSTGRFTAPVAGKYLFSCGLWAQGNSNNWVHIRRNGVGDHAGFHVHNTSASSGTVSVVLQMAANDYVSIVCYFDIQNSTPRNHFSGCLIG
jgi:hypothetical protein